MTKMSEAAEAGNERARALPHDSLVGDASWERDRYWRAFEARSRRSDTQVSDSAAHGEKLANYTDAEAYAKAMFSENNLDDAAKEMANVRFHDALGLEIRKEIEIR